MTMPINAHEEALENNPSYHPLNIDPITILTNTQPRLRDLSYAQLIRKDAAAREEFPMGSIGCL